MAAVQLLVAIKEKKTLQDIDRPKNIKISKHIVTLILSSEYRNLRHTIPLTTSLATTVSNLF